MKSKKWYRNLWPPTVWWPNPSKTTLMILNSKEKSPLEIKVGDSTVNQAPTAKLLCVK
jgi:hypothetical protein